MVRHRFGKRVVKVVDEELKGEAATLERNIIEAPPKQVSFVLKQKDIMLRPYDGLKEGSWKHHAMPRPSFKSLYNSVLQTVMSDGIGEFLCIQCSQVQPISIVGIVQIFADKGATTLKSKAFVVYPVNVVY